MARRNGESLATGLGFGMGTLVQCDSKDESLYCKFAKLINVIVWIVLLIGLFYLVKDFFRGRK